MRVLLVDDEQELVATLAERLSLRGIDADWAATAEEALEKVKDHTYDVAVLDVKIPRMSGLDLKRHIEKIQPGIRFIFMTGHGSERDFEIGAAEAGEEYYLVKPVKLELLIAKMNELMKTEGGQ
ncbi:MAG: response regulator [Thermodesulfobacteriota bacterium]|nr:response regulator [Thermodesulfobacteriota bacterium]